MAEWVLSSVRRTVIDGFSDDITNLKMVFEVWGGGESKSRIKDIIEYLKDADKKRERCSDEDKKKEIDEWTERARKLLYRLEEQIDMSMLPPSKDPVEMACRSLLDLFYVGRCRWPAKLVKEVQGVCKSMPNPNGESTATATEIEPIDACPFIFPRYYFPPGRENVQLEELDEITEIRGGGRKLLFVVGRPGTGKTTLVRLFFYAFPTQRSFDCHSWVVVSRSSERVVLRSVLTGFYRSSSVGYSSEIDNMDEQNLRDKISSCCRGKNYLLVLDDVVNKNAWEWLVGALPDETERSGILIFITRKENLRRKIKPESKEIVVKGLSNEDSLKLFWSVVIPERSSCPRELRKKGDAIARKCKGNPFSIRAMAGMLRTKQATPEAWEDVLKDLAKWENAAKAGKDTLPFVQSAYADLPPHLKSCFLYCCMFPENTLISRKRLIRLWMAEGFVQGIPGKTEEEAAEHQLRQLLIRNMFQVGELGADDEIMSYRIPHLVRKFALDVCDGQKFGSFAPAMGSGRPSNNQAAPAKKCWSHHCQRTTPSLHRVLSMEVEGNAEEITEALTRSSHLRSLLVFGTGKLRRLFRRCRFPRTTNLKIWPYKLLRVLELQGVQIEFLPEQLRYLPLLRYLGLRRTGVNRLPKSLGSLRYLETLDIRETNVVELVDVHGLREMRHLHLASSFRGRSVNVRSGLSFLTHLQTLAGVAYTPELPRKLRRLTQLRKLSVGKVDRTSSKDLCESISKMTLLGSLTIKCERGQTFDLSFLSPPSIEAGAPLQHLCKLKLGGPMDNLLDLVSSLKSITYLYLWDSELEKDPMEALQSLSNLALLSLYNAYVGKHLKCNANGFPRLRRLSILSLTELEKCEIDGNAMPELSELFVGCPKWKEPPKDLLKRRPLEVVKVADEMPEFVKMALKESMAWDAMGRERKKFQVQIIPTYQSA